MTCAWPITVCDGGSRDDTTTIARQAGAAVVTTRAWSRRAARGRRHGRQRAVAAVPACRHGAVARLGRSRARASWHSRRTPQRPATSACASTSADPRARRIERLAAWRCRTFGLPYGDQGLLIERAFYEQLGGFRALPLMEDVDFVRRIGRRKLVALDAEAVTSAERYERDGWLAPADAQPGCLALYFAGLPPSVIRRLYGS